MMGKSYAEYAWTKLNGFLRGSLIRPKTSALRVFHNYLPRAKWILWNNPQDEVKGIIPQYLLSLRRIIVLV